jgi:hypothetical protein
VLTRPHAQNPELAPQQYAVMLVSEEQLDQLMRRPAMRQVNRFAPHDVYARYQKLKRRTAAVAILLLVIAAGGFLWFMAPQPAMASMFPWSGTSALPTIATGASFSVTIASMDSADGASQAAARVRGLGLPAFTRRSPGKYQVYQAMVGPYASLDEAELAQRRLGGLGYRTPRLFVDESLRGTRTEAKPLEAASANPSVLLVGAPDRLSLVLELQSEPREVRSRRPDASTLEIDAGPMAAPAHPQRWGAPNGVHLVESVVVESLSAQGGLNYLRARLALPEFAKANVRTEGTRVYVDLTWPLAEDETKVRRRVEADPASVEAAPTPSAAPAGAVPAAPASAGGRQPAGQMERYQAAIQPVHERINEIRPFLLSGAQSGSPQVLTALDQTLAGVEATLAAMSVPESEVGPHQLLLSAVRMARRGLEPGFSGDRLSHLQKVVTMFEGAMAAPTITAVP